jgi:hypothetical protein
MTYGSHRCHHPDPAEIPQEVATDVFVSKYS